MKTTHQEVTRTLSIMESLRTPHSLRLLAFALGGVLLLAVAALFSPWRQNIDGLGKVSALTPVERQQAIDSTVDGRVVKWHVIEGTHVTKGSPVVDIADLDPTMPERLLLERNATADRIRAATERDTQLGGRIAEVESQLGNDIAASDFRIQQAFDRVQGAERAVDAAEAKELVAQKNVTRLRALLPSGVVSKRQVEVAEAEFNSATADLLRSQASLSESRNSRRTAEAERARTGNAGRALIRDARATQQSARAEIASAQAALQPVQVRLNRQSTQTVLAPADGTIFRLMAQPGSAVLKAGEEIASFVPDNSKPVVELLVAGRDMPLITPGRKVRLQFEGWPAIQFAGWPSVAVGTFGGRVRLIDPTDNGSGKFRLLVEPDPDDAPWPSLRYLRQGVRVHGWVLLNRVTLGFELWRQFNGFAPVVEPEKGAKTMEKKKS
ncbi:MAG: HlyD family secretion protein [Janthinobacterium lividum]